jgi:transcriptional regulator with XRE-family HTH domain
MAGPSPTVGRRRLARLLRRLREDAGLTIDQVAERLELSPSTISRIETAHVGVRPRDVRELLDVYKVTGNQRDELVQLARERRQEAWWQEYKDLPNIPLAGLEAEAASISQYSALLVPGLLHTEEYAREVLSTTPLDTRPLLSDEDAPQLWVVLDEAALRRLVGGAAVMRSQLRRLIDASSLPNVTIQVLPFTAGAHPGMDGEFTILSYRDPADPDVVYIENTGGDLYVENPDVTRRYNSAFDHLRAAALNSMLTDLGRYPARGWPATDEGYAMRESEKMEGLAWRKSSLSVQHNCVEVAFVDGRVAVRDSKDRQGPVLVFSDHEWRAFISMFGHLRAMGLNPAKSIRALVAGVAEM